MKTEIKDKFASYPEHIKPLILKLRAVIFSVAEELDLGAVGETLKWGELSYHVKIGSPVRIDWKKQSPDHYFLFFHCQTKLVDTFRELYSESLVFDGNRAIALDVNEPLPENIIRDCLAMAMRYKHLKHLPLLGV